MADNYNISDESLAESGEFLTEINDGLRIIQKADGLRFGTDALLLAAYMRRNGSYRAADFGAGSGIISLLCASRNKFAHIYAVEIQPEFAGIARRNAALNGFSEKISVICGDANLFSPEAFGGYLDLIFMNPPYMKTDSGKRNEAECKYIARHEVNGDISALCSSAAKNLKFGGLLYVVYRPDRICDLMVSMRENGIEPKRMTFVCQSAEYEPSLVLVEGKRGSGGGCRMTPNLLLRDTHKDMDKAGTSGNAAYTGDMNYIINNGEFNEKFEIL